MKPFQSICVSALLILAATAAWANPVVYSQDDSAYNWPGWLVPSGAPHPNWYDTNGKWTSLNNVDYIGVPDILNAAFTIDSGYLKAISITMKISDTKDWAGGVLPGDFFLNTKPQSDPTKNAWTYEVHNPTSLVSQTTLPQQSAQWNVYNQLIPYGNPTADVNNYVDSTVYSPNPGGWIWRYDEPIQAIISNPGAALMTATLATTLNGQSVGVWPSRTGITAGTYTATWTLSGMGIDFRNVSEFEYGFQVSCANDVIYGRLDPPIPNPEPGTMLLMGIGILGTGLLRKRKKQFP